ncbi:hypothetical protein [Streptomyces silvisoli]|uniref:PH domain-containing protein n=1 Tax=Streptomyces silvisoli TaxID=3034235 RepID=A0ABT5ZW56_9ACTN|nr:hypothetical protein [Streptomyces silvisoli]MDF3294063.1 hypothetical protein [Streptomyces silvisoli]
MPLSFLTADGGHDQPSDAAPTARHHAARDSEDHWWRPYRPGPWRVAIASLLLVIASYLLFAGVIVAAAGGLTGAGLSVGTAVLVIAGALRSLRMGVWVSGRGLRQVGLLRTVTVPWGRVGAVRTAQQPVKWLALPRTVQGQALVLQAADGAEPRTLITDHNADFLGRSDAFDLAADVVEDWATRSRG